MEIGDIRIQVWDDTLSAQVIRDSCYKRDGQYIVSEMTNEYYDTSIKDIINPDISLESKWELIKEFALVNLGDYAFELSKWRMPKKGEIYIMK